MNAKQKWLDAGEVVDAARKVWQESLAMPDADYASSTAWSDYRAAREVEYAAYQEFLASEGVLTSSSEGQQQ
jgi:hypothetical protein